MLSKQNAEQTVYFHNQQSPYFDIYQLYAVIFFITELIAARGLFSAKINK